MQNRGLPGPAVIVLSGECARHQGIEDVLTAADPKLGRVIAAVIARIGRQTIVLSRATPFEALVC
jgi:hypothetical protein